jgi:hypothetical protein
MSQVTTSLEPGKGVNSTPTWVTREKCRYYGCETWCRPGRGMEVHIGRIHSRAPSSSASLFDAMVSKGVKNTIANRSIETDMEIDIDFGDGFAGDNDCDPEEEVESLALPAEPLIEIFHIENHPNLGKGFFSQNSQFLICM